MKKIYTYLILLFGIGLTSCNDSFLDKSPVTGLTEDNAFNSYSNFQSFAWPCYEVFSNTTIATSVNGNGQGSCYMGDENAGYLELKDESSANDYAYQTISSVASGNGWDFSYIRRVNLMLSHIDGSSMTAAEKNHWRAVGYLFHSYWYMELINRFGAVPWVTTVLSEDAPEAYGPRMDRKAVADSVLTRLQWAENNIGNFTSKDGSNTINQDVVRAVLSRFALREGTWRKYHELGDYDKYFAECIRASELLMTKYTTLYTGTDKSPASGYGEMWTTEDLSKVPGIILFKQFTKDILTHSFSHLEHTSSHYVEMNQNTVDLYLMKNGMPIHHDGSGYAGDKTMYNTFRDRDPRLYQCVMPPYKVASGKGTEGYTSWHYTTTPADREYIDIMGANTTCSNPGTGMKRLPAQNWSASLVPTIPRVATGSFVSCRSGYYFWKNYSFWEQNSNLNWLNTSDKPIFKIEEVLLNDAEARFEAGTFSQDIADKTINKLRARAGVAKMVVADIDGNFDPNRGKYYPKNNETGILVDPVLWEIRRERIIELMGEGFGFYDIRRWRMAPWFLNQTPKGIWTTKAFAAASGHALLNEATGTAADASQTEGYIFLWNNPIVAGKGWLEKYYLYQVPTTQILLNPQLTQNPGWETAE
jgi:hypothetical protein